MRPLPHALLFSMFLAILPAYAQNGTWIRPQKAGDPLIWGRSDGIVFGLPSPGGMAGPRGLIRVGTKAPNTGEAKLLNFIAVEPVVEGKKPRGYRMAFSELEKSRLDKGKRGARLWVGGWNPAQDAGGGLVDDRKTPMIQGTLLKEHRGNREIEVLTVRIEMERFSPNKAHLYLLLSIEADHPNELHLSAFPYDDSKPLDEVVFTATMGAYERLRLLWLKDKIVDSRKLYGSYIGYDFAESDVYPFQEMLQDREGNPIVFCTSSERKPAEVRNPQARPNWYYNGPRLTQYWRVSASDVASNLRARVNGRYTYWQSKDTIPGGTTFENFELREKFHPGQAFIFGISSREPFEWVPSLADLAASPELE
jgi:hypothetical protein